MALTQGTSARAAAYRAVVREFEEMFRYGPPGAEAGRFSEMAILLLPKAKALLLRAIEHDLGRPIELPPNEEVFRGLQEGNPKLQEQLQKLLMSRVGCELIQHGQWMLNGRRVYDLSPTLFANLIETDFSRLRGEDIPVPLRGFYVHLPEAKRLGIEREGLVLDGLYVRQADLLMVDGLKPHLEVLVFLVNPEDEADELSIALAVPLYGDVEDFVQETRIGVDPEDSKFADQFIRLVIGLCFYLSCDDADVEREHFGPSPEIKAKAKKLGGRAGKKLLAMSTIPVHYLRVGHRAEATPELENLAGADASIDGETRKLLRRHVVRGHFRRQPCGPGRTERKTIFVRSFWKGPSWTEAVGAIHKVKERTAS